jgi:hypothetical protein
LFASFAPRGRKAGEQKKKLLRYTRNGRYNTTEDSSGQIEKYAMAPIAAERERILSGCRRAGWGAHPVPERDPAAGLLGAVMAYFERTLHY